MPTRWTSWGCGRGHGGAGPLEAAAAELALARDAPVSGVRFWAPASHQILSAMGAKPPIL